MRLGRAEKAGSGVDKIVNGWRSLGWQLPTVAEETRPDYVVLTMPLGMKNRQEKPTNRLLEKSGFWSSALSQSLYLIFCNIWD